MPLYLQLFHGRRDPDEELDDWGSNGPTLGPLEAVSTTYGTVRLALPASEVDLPLVDDLLHYDGVLYGDSCTFIDDQRPDAVLPLKELAVVRVPEWIRRAEHPSVPVVAEQVADYLQSVQVFRDILLDLGGDRLATAAARALRRVVRTSRR